MTRLLKNFVLTILVTFPIIFAMEADLDKTAVLMKLQAKTVKDLDAFVFARDPSSAEGQANQLVETDHALMAYDKLSSISDRLTEEPNAKVQEILGLLLGRDGNNRALAELTVFQARLASDDQQLKGTIQSVLEHLAFASMADASIADASIAE